jgi:hypothetical protein
MQKDLAAALAQLRQAAAQHSRRLWRRRRGSVVARVLAGARLLLVKWTGKSAAQKP